MIVPIADVDQHPAAIARQPDRERHEQEAQDDQQDDREIEHPDDGPGGEQPVGGHQPDRPERRPAG